MADKIRVLIADDDPAMREALADLIFGDESLELVGVGEDAEQAIELTETHRPDVAVLDVMMPGGGERAARAIRQRSPGTAIIALSAHEDDTSVNDMLAAGAGSYLVKGASTAQILGAIRGSATGRSTLSEGVATQVVRQLASRLEQERSDDERRSEWGGRILRILQGEDHITMVFQPIVDLETGRIVGLEALSRFLSEPVRTPDVWFAEAALAGLGTELEMVAVEAALAALEAIPQDVYMSVNASPESVGSARLEQLLDEVPMDRVVLEITEHAPVKDYPQLRMAIMRMREGGIRLAVDDAGAGYASLRHILQLTPDIIKLDITLTRDIDTGRPQRALATALVAFAREIEATIAAEGIETPSELSVLRDLGVTLGQGYYLGRPGPLPQDYVVPGIGAPAPLIAGGLTAAR